MIETKYYLEEGFLKAVYDYLDCYLEENQNPFQKKEKETILKEFFDYLSKEVRRKEPLPF